ncbi:MAG TPA: hypothetical protein VFW52_03245 [Candidatus Saccharimonadales bacterium]|nr:hypothetical protein [Candidatus Saccharimonadales bacterium]
MDFQFPGDIWLVAVAIVEALLRIAGFVAVIAIIASGVRYMFSGGNPEKAASARRGIINSFIGLAIALVAAGFVAFLGNKLGGDNVSAFPQTPANDDTLKVILTIVFMAIGAIAFLLMVIAGLRYVLAQGDPQKIATAKNQIIYTAIGLILAASAAAIVNFVIGQT